MQLRFAFLAEHANVTEDGKLNVLGIFDRLYAPNFPALHRVLYLVASYEADPGDAQAAHEMEVRFIDPDAQAVRDIRGRVELGSGKQVVNQLHVFNDLPFQVPGNYEFALVVNGEIVKTVGLELVEVAPSGAV